MFKNSNIKQIHKACGEQVWESWAGFYSLGGAKGVDREVRSKGYKIPD